MAKQTLRLVFPQKLIREPVIYKMSKKFEVVFNIRRAKVTETAGEVVLELEGADEELSRAVEWLTAQGVKSVLAQPEALEG